MNIDEFIEDLKTKISKGEYTIDRRKVLRNLEAELKGALIIPEGVSVVDSYYSEETTLWTVTVEFKGIRFMGQGHHMKALRNALEQIETK